MSGKTTDSPVRSGMRSISVDRGFMLAVALFAVGYLAWNCFDAARHIGVDGPWFENLFLIFVMLAYGFFALAVCAAVLNEIGLVARLRSAWTQGRRA